MQTKDRTVDLNDILIFTRVVEARSFTAAARGLGMPKSNVSRRVAQLEDRLGVRLLQRTTRKLNLTDAGRSYYEYGIRIVAEVEEAEQAVTHLQAAPRGQLRITAPVEFGMAFLGQPVAEFMHRYPEVSVEAELTDRKVDMIEEGFDVAIRIGRLSDSSLIARRIGQIARVLCASPDYLARHSAPQNLQELTQHNCILWLNPEVRWAFQDPEGNEIVLSVSGSLKANNISFMRDAAIQGMGIALLPTLLCCEALNQGSLIALLPEYQPVEAGIYAIYPSRRHLASKIRLFVDFLGERLPSIPLSSTPSPSLTVPAATAPAPPLAGR